MADVNWLKIRNEYISGNISYRKLSENHKVSFQTLRDRAIKEKWAELRNIQRNKIGTTTAQKTAEKIAEQESDYIVNIDRLKFKLARALEGFIESGDFNATGLKALSGTLKEIQDIQNNMPSELLKLKERELELKEKEFELKKMLAEKDNAEDNSLLDDWISAIRDSRDDE